MTSLVKNSLSTLALLRGLLLATLLLCCAQAFSGSSQIPGPFENQGAEPAFVDAVKAHWAALESRDWESAYKGELSSIPSSDEHLTPMQYYANKNKSRPYEKPHLVRVAQDGDEGQALVFVGRRVSTGGASFLTPRIYETSWKRVDGGWFLASSPILRIEGADKKYPSAMQALRQFGEQIAAGDAVGD